MTRPDRNRQKLIALGVDRLADALLVLADHHDVADELVKRMIATPKENIKRFKAKLSGLKRMRRYVRWSEVRAFAKKLSDLLEDLKAGVDDPKTGVELVAAFYEIDHAIFDHVDDSMGCIGDIYRFDAKDLFVSYAARCEDKEWVAHRVIHLNRENEYGIRDALIECAADYLPDPVMDTMADQFWQLSLEEKDEYRKRAWLSDMAILARQLKDGPLFEKAHRTARPELSASTCIEIAEVYHLSGETLKALSWLERISEGETFMAGERDELFLDIYGKLNHREKQDETAWRIFQRHRSEETLVTLLSVIGEDQREAVLDQEAEKILFKKELCCSDATFLIDAGHIDQAERYLLRRTDQLNGDFYTPLLGLADALEKAAVLEKKERSLVVSALYRALLDSILARAISKYYTHGVRYLKKLDGLEAGVRDWRHLMSHVKYREKLLADHGRKHSFWTRYDDEST